MSSHHVIRDNQEAAVVVLDVENLNFEVLGDALAWSPFVIVSNQAAEVLHERAHKIDLIIGEEMNDFVAIHEEQRDIQFLKQSSPMVVEAMNIAIKNNHPAVLIFSHFKDELFKLKASFKIPVSVIDGTKKWTLVSSGKIKKWFKNTDYIEVDAPQDVFLNDKKMVNSKACIQHDGLVELISSASFWLGEDLS